jgi:hypothetical protein
MAENRASSVVVQHRKNRIRDALPCWLTGGLPRVLAPDVEHLCRSGVSGPHYPPGICARRSMDKVFSENIRFSFFSDALHERAESHLV